MLGIALGGKTMKMHQATRRQPSGAGHHHRQGRDHLDEPRLRGGQGQPAEERRADPCLAVRWLELRHRAEGRPVFSVQYHPEASPGRDSHYFTRFVELMRRARPRNAPRARRNHRSGGSFDVHTKPPAADLHVRRRWLGAHNARLPFVLYRRVIDLMARQILNR
jgi:hypothetical protein